MSDVVAGVQGVVARLAEADRPDGQLLESWVRGRDEAAFEALVRRHGPMVLGVCRRVTGHSHDAEDAFQAAFLVLARRAASVRPRERLANWLYGVAYRTALKGRAAARRRRRERQVTTMPQPQAKPEPADDLGRLLDREVSGLPEKYRIPFVLCELEGRTYKETARLLGVSEGAVSLRLVRARAKLAERLSRQGLAVSAGTLAAVRVADAAGPVPALLASSTVRAAVAFTAGRTTDTAPAAVTSLADGVLGAMRLSALKTAAVLVVAGLGVGLAVAGVWSRTDRSSHAAARVVTDTPPTPKVGGDEKGKAPAGGAGDPPPKAGPYGFVARGATVKDGKVVFDLEYGRRVTGLVQFIVKDENGKTLWSVRASGQTPIKQVTYGVVPADPSYDPTYLKQQAYPEDGQPPADIRGKTVRLRIDYRFVQFGAGVEIYEIPLQIPKE